MSGELKILKEALNLAQLDVQWAMDNLDRIFKERNDRPLTDDVDEERELAQEVIDEIKKLPNNMILYRFVKLPSVKKLNKKKLGVRYFSDKKFIPDLLPSLEDWYDDTFTDAELYLMQVQAPKKNINIEQTLYQRWTQPDEHEITMETDKGIKLIKIERY